LHNGEGVSKDLKGGAYYLKLAADQGNAAAQFNYVLLL
jgi:TPR repeat protein